MRTTTPTTGQNDAVGLVEAVNALPKRLAVFLTGRVDHLRRLCVDLADADLRPGAPCEGGRERREVPPGQACGSGDPLRSVVRTSSYFTCGGSSRKRPGTPSNPRS
jgi:hypothetical protein